jgi:DNA-binding MarR family transcriptional regulator
VERRSCPTDRRGSYASLTGIGRSKLDEAEPIHSAVIREHLIGSIGDDEVDVFRRVTDGIGRSLGAQPGDAACG